MKNFIIVLVAMIGICSMCPGKEPVRSLNPKKFSEAFKSDTTAVVLDVRTPSEYAEGHIPGAIMLDVKDAGSFENGLGCLRKDKTYYVYCRSGRRSLEAASVMQSRGFSVVNMEGGFLEWSAAGL